MKMKWGIIAGVLGGIAAAEAGGSAYFYRRTMMRYHARCPGLTGRAITAL